MKSDYLLTLMFNIEWLIRMTLVMPLRVEINDSENVPSMQFNLFLIKLKFSLIFVFFLKEIFFELGMIRRPISISYF